MFIIRNYNKFLVGTVDSFQWEDFYVHRWPEYYDKLLKFETREAAELFVEQHPEVDGYFDGHAEAWIVHEDRSSWTGSITVP